MEGPYGALFRIDHQHRDAISRLHADQQPGNIRDQPISRECIMPIARDPMHYALMHLLHLHQRPWLLLVTCSDSLREPGAIALHVLTLVVLGDAEVQGARTINVRQTSEPRAETMHEPRYVEVRGAQHLKLRSLALCSGFAGSFHNCRHPTIVNGFSNGHDFTRIED